MISWCNHAIKLSLHYRYSEDLELEDAVHTAILTLKEGFEGQMTEDNIEIGICNDGGFRWVDWCFLVLN